MSLESLGLKYGTDKSSSRLNYLIHYERYFKEFINRPIKLLEIGIKKGSSLLMWNEYFPSSVICGMDISKGSCNNTELKEKGIKTFLGDQGKIEDLNRLWKEYGPFDVVIDDGSHVWKHQIDTFHTIFPKMSNGGLFILEDLHTSQLPEQYSKGYKVNPLDYLLKLAKLYNVFHIRKCYPKIKEQSNKYVELIDFISFHPALCFIGRI